MNLEELTKKIESLTSDLQKWQELAQTTHGKELELKKLAEELTSREGIIKKETEIARQRKEVLDEREKIITAQEARLARLPKP